MRRLRKAGQTGQKELSALAGVRQSTISDIEQGRASPRVDTLEKLAKALGVTLVQLVGGSDHVYPAETEPVYTLWYAGPPEWVIVRATYRIADSEVLVDQARVVGMSPGDFWNGSNLEHYQAVLQSVWDSGEPGEIYYVVRVPSGKRVSRRSVFTRRGDMGSRTCWRRTS